MTLSLVTLARAKMHLQIVDNAHDADILFKSQQASRLVIDVCKIDLGSPEQLPWADVPEIYQMWTLLFMAALYYNREADVLDLMSKIKNVITLYRYPSMA
jgi:hypothetical protein